MQRHKGWLATCAVAVGLLGSAGAAELTVDAGTGLPLDANYVETKGVTLNGFTSQTVTQGTRFLVGGGESYDGGGTYSFDANGCPLRLTTGSYANGTATVAFDASAKFAKPIRAASLYLEGGRFSFFSANLLKDAGPVYTKAHIYTNQSSFANDFFFSPSNYVEENQAALTSASLRIEANPTTLSGTVTLLPKVEGDAKDCVRLSSHGSTRTLKIGTLDLTRIAADGTTVLDLQNVSLEVDTVRLPADFAGTLTCTVAGGGTWRSVGNVLLGDTPLAPAKWALFENTLKVQGLHLATAEGAEVAFPEGVAWGEAPAYDGTAVASLTLTQNDGVVTLDATKPLAGLKLLPGSEAVTAVTLVMPQAFPYPIDWGTLNVTVRLTAPSGTVSSTSAYATVLAAAEPVAETLTLTPAGGTLTVDGGTYGQAAINANGTQTSLNFTGGDLSFSGDFQFSRATVTVSGGTIKAKRLVTGNSWGCATSFTQTGGDIVLSSEEDNGSAFNKATILLGHWLEAPQSTHTISGGRLIAENGTIWLGKDASAALMLQGNAVVIVKGIRNGGRTDSVLNLEGGELRVGAWGMPSAFGFNLKGGRYVATASHTLATPAVTATGTTTTLAAEAGQTLTVSGALSGSGAIVLAGEGTVDLRRLGAFEGTLALTQGALTLGVTHLGKLTQIAGGTTLNLVAPTLGALALPKDTALEGTTFTINGYSSTATAAEDGTVTVTPNLHRYTLALPAGETALSAATILDAEGAQTALADMVAPAQLTVTAAADATLVADAAATLAGLRFEVAEGKTLTLKVASGATALSLTAQYTELSGNLCAIGLAGALGKVFVAEDGEFAWQSNAKNGAPASVFGPGTFRVVPNASNWDAQGGIGVSTFVDGLGENALGRFVLDGGAHAIRIKLPLPAGTRLEVRNNAQFWTTVATMERPLRVAGSVKATNTWGNEGFGCVRTDVQTFNGSVTLEEGAEALMGNQNATSLTFNETVSGLGRLVVGTYYDTHATSVTLNKALPDGMTLGGLTLRNTGKGNAATGVTTVTAAQDTLRGAAVSFDFGHGSAQPNVSWLKVMGNNTIASLTANAGGNLSLAPGATLEAQEASSIAGDFALDGAGTLKARSLAVSGTLRNAARAAHTARYVRWNLLAYCPSGSNSGYYALAELGLQHQGQAVDLTAATASASSTNTHPAARLVDGLLGTDNKWMSGNVGQCWVQLDAGEGKTFTFDGYRLAMADVNGRNPRKWNVQISDDGENWTAIDEKDYPEQEAKTWCSPNSWVPFDFYPIAAIETTEGLTVENGGTLAYAGTLKGALRCEAGATLHLSATPILTLEGGTLTATGATTITLPEGAAEGDLLVACTDATEATAAFLTTDNDDLKVVATAEGYRLAKNVTLQAADGSALPQVEDLLSMAYAAGIRGAVTVKAVSAGGAAAKASVADLLACFTGLTATADADAATLTVVCDFGITRAMAKAVEGHEGRCLVVEAQVRTGEGGTATFAEGTAVTLTLDPVPEADIVEVTDWSAATPGAAQGNARYFRLPLEALTPTTKLKVRATKP